MFPEEPRGAHLDQSRVEVDVVRHDDGSDDPHRLSQLDGPTALTVWNKHPLQQVRLVWSHCHVLDGTKEFLYQEALEALEVQNNEWLS